MEVKRRSRVIGEVRSPILMYGMGCTEGVKNRGWVLAEGEESAGRSEVTDEVRSHILTLGLS